MKRERVYMLWAECTPFFKIGFTRQFVGKRALSIETSSPFPLRIIGSFAGSRADEIALHKYLANYRTHGEWFALPEDIVWFLLPLFICNIPLNYSALQSEQ